MKRMSFSGWSKIVWLLALFSVVGTVVMGAEKRTITPLPEATPIPLGPEGSKPLVFDRIISRIPVGKEIGTFYDGWLKLPKYEYKWGRDVIVGFEDIVITANQTLKEYGYTVPGGDNPLFDTGQGVKATYQLGGIITDFVLVAYGASAGNYCEVLMTLEWQLFDTFQKKVVYTATTSGYGKIKGISGEVIDVAFRAALKALLAKEDFVALVGKKEVKAPTWDRPIIIPLAKGKTLNLPDEMEKVLASVVMIRAGSTVASGVIISTDGYILTAEHVVNGVEEVMVSLKSGLSLPAKVIRTDPSKDLALIKIPGSGYQPVALATKERAPLGSAVFAVGSPADEEFAFSVARGIVSAYRQLKEDVFLQTDANLSPGYSGGPLLNAKGELIGIVSWKIIGEGFEGLCFGVPLEVVAESLGIKWE